jgi:transcriptional regulator with XRE-family HTH domain
MIRISSMSEFPIAVSTSRRLGQKLRVLRTQRGITLQELADALAVTNGYLSLIENGKREPRATLLFKMSRILNVSTDHLLDDDIDIDVVLPPQREPTVV